MHRLSNSQDESCEWVDQYGDAMYRYTLARTGDRGVAEELVQETFLAAIAGKSGFKGESSVSTWLFAILKRKTADYFRRQNNHNEAMVGDDTLQTIPTSLDRSVHWRDDPAAIFEDQEFWKTFDRCVEKLPNKLSEVFILREVNQYSAKEVCELLGLGATNLSMRLHRCRLALRECLNRNWFDDKGK
ncbi:MAG: sigma-70 family RNA polymerase sigma factor [Planctomycetales bacterium]|nr:sigma-70 family RNA polymerase sigma factor [Planctomycetales bacterium]